jgi:predicted TIM-barrel fold metal-dependent hydrolase
MSHTIEAAIDPEIPIVDAHHHLWQTPTWRYLYPDLLADLDCGHAVDATVYVEGGSLHPSRIAGGTMYRADGPDLWAPVGEVEFASGVGAMADSAIYGRTRACAGVVGFVDLNHGAEVAGPLDAMCAFPRMRGVRYITGWNDDPDLRKPGMLHRPGLLRDPTFRRGLRELARRGLSFETSVHHHQLPDLADVARDLPDLTIIVCHLGGPVGIGRKYAGRPKEAFADWKSCLAEFAACPNAHVKLGGLAQRHTGLIPAPGLSSEQIAGLWRDHVLTGIDLFGPRRCMFESNTPVDTTHMAYGTLWNAFKRLTAGFSDSERIAMFGGTARKVYRLPDREHS